MRLCCLIFILICTKINFIKNSNEFEKEIYIGCLLRQKKIILRFANKLSRKKLAEVGKKICRILWAVLKSTFANLDQKLEWWVFRVLGIPHLGKYEKEYLLMFLCSSLNLQNLGVFFEGLYLLIYFCQLYTLSSGKMKTWFIDLYISIGIYDLIFKMLKKAHDVLPWCFALMRNSSWLLSPKFQLLKFNELCFCVKDALRKCHQTS